MWWILIVSAMLGFGYGGFEGMVYGPFIGLGVMLVLLWITKLLPDDTNKARTVRKRDVKNLPGYRNGHEYEYFVAAYLKRKGYTDVKVTRKSGDFGADVICTSPNGYRLAVQCKLYQSPVGYRAVEEAVGGMHYYKCDGAMVVTNNTYTRQAKEAAHMMGVTLIEGVH